MPRPRTPHILALTPLPLLLALLTLHLTGGWSDPSGRTHPLPFLPRWSFSPDASHTELQLLLFHDTPTPTYGPPLPPDPTAHRAAWSAWTTTHPPYLELHALPFPHGFALSHEPNLATDPATNRPLVAGTRTWLMIPYWFAELTLLLPALLLYTPPLLRRLRRPLPQGLCPTCHYDLRASPNRCPECGTPHPNQDPVPHETSGETEVE